VVGLQQPYRIEDINWREVDPNSKTFEKVIGWFRISRREALSRMGPIYWIRRLNRSGCGIRA